MDCSQIGEDVLVVVSKDRKFIERLLLCRRNTAQYQQFIHPCLRLGQRLHLLHGVTLGILPLLVLWILAANDVDVFTTFPPHTLRFISVSLALQTDPCRRIIGVPCIRRTAS